MFRNTCKPSLTPSSPDLRTAGWPVPEETTRWQEKPNNSSSPTGSHHHPSALLPATSLSSSLVLPARPSLQPERLEVFSFSLCLWEGKKLPVLLKTLLMMVISSACGYSPC